MRGVQGTAALGLVVLLLAGARPLRAETLAVPDDYDSIQEAIDEAVGGDVVLVAAGTYVETLDFLGKDITVRSEDGPADTIISADSLKAESFPGSVVTFTGGEGPDAVLEGFTVREGTGTVTTGIAFGDETDTAYGGGIFCVDSSPTIRNCILADNRAIDGDTLLQGIGGGIYAESSGLILEAVVIEHGTADSGAGIYLHAPTSDAVFTDCTFEDNVGGDLGSGGGLVVYEGGPLTLTACVFQQNSAFIAGGLYLIDVDIALRACRLDRNTATFGGGLVTTGGDLTLVDSELVSNDGETGGAVLFDGFGVVTITHCLLVGNDADEGAAVHGSINVGSVRIHQTTLVENTADSGAVVHIPGADPPMTVELRNCIVWANGTDALESEGELAVAYCDIEGGHDGDGNIDEDPVFINPESVDYRLQIGSPCIDSGDPDEPLDEDGSASDMGAFPFAVLFKRGDVNGDGTVSGLTDGLFLLHWQFSDGDEPLCQDAADVNDNGVVGALGDAIHLLLWNFSGRGIPPAPGPNECGEDPTDDDIGCETLPACD